MCLMRLRTLFDEESNSHHLHYFQKFGVTFYYYYFNSARMHSIDAVKDIYNVTKDFPNKCFFFFLLSVR